MSVQQQTRRPFKGEILLARQQSGNLETAPTTGGIPAPGGQLNVDNGDVLRAIASLRDDVMKHLDPDGGAAEIAEQAPVAVAEVAGASSLVENEELTRQLNELAAAIEEAKQEVWSLRDPKAQSGDDVKAATKELDAVVRATEVATNDIMEAAEQIDDLAARLCSQLSGTDAALAEEINERVVNIFEACNFQDITGQRITKVVSTLEFIDERVSKMMELWGAAQIEGGGEAGEVSDEDLLHGPSMDGEGATQDDIDALFD